MIFPVTGTNEKGSLQILETTVGSLAKALVCTFAPPAAQIGMLGALVSVLAGLFLTYSEQEEQRESMNLAWALDDANNRPASSRPV